MLCGFRTVSAGAVAGGYGGGIGDATDASDTADADAEVLCGPRLPLRYI